MFYWFRKFHDDQELTAGSFVRKESRAGERELTCRTMFGYFANDLMAAASSSLISKTV
jgi:hypothetical protein